MHELLLNELPWRGVYFTWNNKQHGEDKVCSRLDRALGNNDWMIYWGHVVLEYDLPNIVDHSPMLLTVNTNQQQVKVPFRFFIARVAHKDFNSIVQQT